MMRMLIHRIKAGSVKTRAKEVNINRNWASINMRTAERVPAALLKTKNTKTTRKMRKKVVERRGKQARSGTPPTPLTALTTISKATMGT